MNKYFNIIIIAFFSVLTYNYGISLALYVPIACFLVFNNSKNIFLLLPLSLAAIFFLIPEALLITCCFMLGLLLYLLVIKPRSNAYVDLVFVFGFCMLTLILDNKTFGLRDLLFYLIVSTVSTLCYEYFLFNYEGSYKSKSKFRSFAYVEAIMGFICVLGGATQNIFDINIGIILGIFYAMYLSSNLYIIHSLGFSILTLLALKYLYATNSGLLILIASSLYLFPNIYGSIALIGMCIIAYFLNISFFEVNTLLATMATAIFFEIFRFTIVNINDTKKTFIKRVYEKTIDNVNTEVLGFATFLDIFSKNFSSTKEYNQKISEAIQNLMNNYCENCYQKKECFLKNRGKLYSYFKDLILYANNINLHNDTNDHKHFYKSCPYIIEMRKSSILLNQRLNINASISKTNALVAQMNGFSNVLRQFAVENATKNEIEYDVLYDIKNALIMAGLQITLFNVQKIFTDDFLIEIGIRSTFKEVEDIIQKIGNLYLKDVSVIYMKSERNKTYVTVVPKIKYEIDYGYGIMAQNGNSVCGDNYLIKQLSTSKMIAAISDGMGKGLIANQESNATLKLVDAITDMPISTTTSLQMLNTFYFIQDYLEHYSTLDFLELNRSTGKAYVYKMGASTTYIFHGDGSFEKIINENLPFGIEEIIDIKTVDIKNHDLIIMASDGVFENIVDEEDLENYIKQIMHLDPQKITYELLNYTKNHKVKVEDDMSVIAIKVAAA